MVDPATRSVVESPADVKAQGRGIRGYGRRAALESATARSPPTSYFIAHYDSTSTLSTRRGGVTEIDATTSGDVRGRRPRHGKRARITDDSIGESLGVDFCSSV